MHSSPTSKMLRVMQELVEYLNEIWAEGEL
jgi:hypothetical protein